jgi:hypothetical protein
MKNRVVFSLFIFLSAFSRSQELLPAQLDTTVQSQRVSLNGSAFYLTSGIQNELSNKLLFGGEITDEIKLSSLEEHDVLNRVGGDIGFRLQYFSDKSFLKKYDELSWMLDFGYETHFAGQYAESLFGLAFFGNEQYLGENANFSNSFGRIQSFYTAGFGLHHKKNNSFFSINAILPTSDGMASLDRGNLNTSINADTVILAIKGDFKQATSPAYFQGIGAAVNFDFNIPIKTVSSNMTGFMSISGRNLGAYYLNSVSSVAVDANIQFEGYSIADLVSLQENTESILNDSLNVARDTTSEWRMTPGFIQVGKIVEKYTDKQVQAFFGVRMYTNRVYRPLGYLGIHWTPVLNWSVGAQLSFGGYGNFRGGIYAGYTSDRLSISIGTEDILGVILDSQFGQSALMKLSWNI